MKIPPLADQHIGVVDLAPAADDIHHQPIAPHDILSLDQYDITLSGYSLVYLIVFGFKGHQGHGLPLDQDSSAGLDYIPIDVMGHGVGLYLNPLAIGTTIQG